MTIEGGLGWQGALKINKHKLLKEQDNSTSTSMLYLKKAYLHSGFWQNVFPFTLALQSIGEVMSQIGV